MHTKLSKEVRDQIDKIMEEGTRIKRDPDTQIVLVCNAIRASLGLEPRTEIHELTKQDLCITGRAILDDEEIRERKIAQSK